MATYLQKLLRQQLINASNAASKVKQIATVDSAETGVQTTVINEPEVAQQTKANAAKQAKQAKAAPVSTANVSDIDTVLTYTGQEVQQILDKANQAPIDKTATATEDGLMDNEDKRKLDDIQEATVEDILDICK